MTTSDVVVVTDELDGEFLPAVRTDVSPTLFNTSDPAAVIVAATAAAEPLAAVVRKQGLTTTISGREYCRVEAWTLLGSMLGVFPICTWTRKLENGWEARVEARTIAGALVGAAEAECLRSESTWEKRDDYALRSMAQTRATSKALRQPLGFVMQLAGFEATPAEEVPAGGFGDAADDSPITDPASVTLSFGKHKGKTLAEAPREYLEWWVSQKPPTNADMVRQRRAAEMFLAGDADEIVGGAGIEDDIPFQRTFA